MSEPIRRIWYQVDRDRRREPEVEGGVTGRDRLSVAYMMG